MLKANFNKQQRKAAKKIKEWFDCMYHWNDIGQCK